MKEGVEGLLLLIHRLSISQDKNGDNDWPQPICAPTTQSVHDNFTNETMSVILGKLVITRQLRQTKKTNWGQPQRI